MRSLQLYDQPISFEPGPVPVEIFTTIFFTYITGAELGALLTTSKRFSKWANDPLKWKVLFDKEGLPYFDEVKCRKYRGEPGDVPFLSWAKAYQFYNRPCPLFPDKRVVDTHKLQLFYKEIDGISITLNRAGELANNPKAESNGCTARFSGLSWNTLFEVFGNRPLDRSFWGFVVTKPLEESVHKDTEDKKMSIEELLQLAAKHPSYRLHKTVERSIANFDNVVEKGEYLDAGASSTICEETIEYNHDGISNKPTRVVVGSGCPEGLNAIGDFEGYNVGVALLREF